MRGRIGYRPRTVKAWGRRFEVQADGTVYEIRRPRRSRTVTRVRDAELAEAVRRKATRPRGGAEI